MDIQYLIVISIILAAVIFGAKALLHKRHAFSLKSGCDNDCGCGK